MAAGVSQAGRAGAVQGADHAAGLRPALGGEPESCRGLCLGDWALASCYTRKCVGFVSSHSETRAKRVIEFSIVIPK